MISDVKEVDWKLAYLQIEELLPILQRLDEKKAQLDAHRPLPTYALRKIRESLHLEFTHNSTAIEGNSLTLSETRVVLHDGMTVKGKSLREHFEVLNHHDALLFVEEAAQRQEPLSDKLLHEIHSFLLQRIEKEMAGRYRNMGVRILGANFTPPNALKVPDYMDDLFDWLNNLPANTHPIVRATLFHHRFVWIHPYFDGNGRTARLAHALLLMKAGYPPAFVLNQDRKRYYRCLNSANEGNYAPFMRMMALAAERSLDLYLGALEDRYDDYLPLGQLVEEPTVPYGAEYLGLLARQGKLAAFKQGKEWYASKAEVLQYVAKRQRQRKLGPA